MINNDMKKVILDQIKISVVDDCVNDNIVSEYNKNKKLIYVIKEKDRVVEVIKFIDKDEMLDFIAKKIMNNIVVVNNEVETIVKNIVKEYYNIKQVYKSSVFCLPEDTWDKNKGKKLALLKMNMEYKKDMVKLFKKLSTIFSYMSSNVTSLNLKFNKSLIKNKVSYYNDVNNI